MAEHESLLTYRDPAIGYCAFIGIHSTVLGPATGGTRIACYASGEDAIADVLRLSRAMSYKAAIAELPAGGGKSVIMGNLIRDRAAVLRRHAEMIESLHGRYVTAPDIGTTPEDMEYMAGFTSYVARHRVTRGADGTDTARGVYAAIRAAVTARWNEPTVSGIRVIVQGAGNVGRALSRLLRDAGAVVTVSDVDEGRAATTAHELGAHVVRPSEIFAAETDVFAPCAVGGVLTGEVVDAIRCGAIAGGANNPLADESLADRLHRRGIIMVPDYVASGGGLIAGVGDRMGLSRARIFDRIDGIGTTASRVLSEAKDLDESPLWVANRLAEERLTRRSTG